MNLKPYTTDFEVLEEFRAYLLLLKKGIRNDKPRSSPQGPDPESKSKEERDFVKESRLLKDTICKRLALSRKKKINLRITQAASKYRLNDFQLDVVLILVIEEMTDDDEPMMTLKEFGTAFSDGRLKKVLTIREDLGRLVTDKVIWMKSADMPLALSSNVFQEIIGIRIGTHKSFAKTREEKLEKLREKITSPKIIYQELSRYVMGQEKAKRAISVGVYNHIMRITLALKGKTVEKSNILMLGPTGTGKTYMVKILARFLDLPLASGDSTSITEAGYVGEDVEGLLWRLCEAAGNRPMTEIGIVFLDEVDKIAASGMGNLQNRSNRDIGGAGVQRALLKLMEGTLCSVPEGNEKYGCSKYHDVRTDNILFIAGGAFNGLDDIIKERLCVSPIGFQCGTGAQRPKNTSSLLNAVETCDLVRFGMLPEFIGRLPVRVCFHELSEEHLCDILTKAKEGPISEFEALFKESSGGLSFSEDGVRAIAREALKAQTGARGLRALLEEVMSPIIFAGNGESLVVDEKRVYSALKEREKEKVA